MFLKDIIARIRFDRDYRIIAAAVISLTVNLLYAFYNGILGILASSAVFGASCVYYLLLSIMGFYGVLQRGKASVTKIIGALLTVLGIFYPLIIYFSISRNTAAVHGTIPMITIATYTFAKIITAAISEAKYKRTNSHAVKAINYIRYAQVAVALLTMQQSMLVSFGSIGKAEILLNAFTGAAVCVFIFTLGILMLRINKEDSNVKDS